MGKDIEGLCLKISDGNIDQEVINEIKKYLQANSDVNSFFVLRLEKQSIAKKERYFGTVASYIELLKDPGNSYIYCTAGESVYRSIIQLGYVSESEMLPERAAVLKRMGLRAYNAFENYFFDLEDVLEKLMSLIGGGATRGELSKKVIVIHGPGGSGKTVLVEHLKNLLTQFVKEPVYYIEGCPRHCQPLFAIPYLKRDKYQEDLKLVIDGDICSDCKSRLKDDYVDFLNMPVTSDNFSHDFGIGYGEISVSDLANSAQGGSDQLFANDGPINASNRGLFIINELTSFSSPQLNRIDINRMTQKRISTPDGKGVMHIDNVIIATGRSDKRSTLDTDVNCSDRIEYVEIHLCLSLWGELGIYARMLGHKDLPAHKNTDVWIAVAVASLFTRYKEEPSYLSQKLKMQIYSGIKPVFTKNINGNAVDIDRKFLRQKYPSDGMAGINPRYSTGCITKAVANIFQDDPANIVEFYNKGGDSGKFLIDKTTGRKRCGCLNFYQVLCVMYDDLEKNEQYKKDLDFNRRMIDQAHEYMIDDIVDRINKFLTFGFEDKVNELRDRYIDNACRDTERILYQFSQLGYDVYDKKTKTDDELEKYFGKVVNDRILYRKTLQKTHSARAALDELRKSNPSSVFTVSLEHDPFDPEPEIDVDFLEDVEMSAISDKFSYEYWRQMSNLRRRITNKSAGRHLEGKKIEPHDIQLLYSIIKKYVKQIYNLYSVDDMIKDVEFHFQDGKIRPKNRVYTDGELLKFKELIDWMIIDSGYCKECALFTLNHLGKRLKSGNKKLK